MNRVQLIALAIVIFSIASFVMRLKLFRQGRIGRAAFLLHVLRTIGLVGIGAFLGTELYDRYPNAIYGFIALVLAAILLQVLLGLRRALERNKPT